MNEYKENSSHCIQKKRGIEIVIKIFYDLPNLLGGVICTPETRFCEPRYSEILNSMKKLQLPFSYFALYPDSI